MAEQTFTSTTTWTSPITGDVIVETWGSGAGGHHGQTLKGGAGGGGGAYAKVNAMPVTKDTVYDVTVGAQVGSSTDGNFSQFVGDGGVTCKAVGGKTGASTAGGAGGAAADCIGDVRYSGGDGGARTDSNYTGAGGGGEGAGTTEDGHDGQPNSGQNGGAGGTGGDGGDGGAGDPYYAGDPVAGSVPGGGGGGGCGSVDTPGAAGARGQVKLSWPDFMTQSPDTLPVIQDSISATLNRHFTARVSDRAKVPVDALAPPPIEATHLTGTLSDSLGPILDAISRLVYGNLAGAVSDTAGIIRDAITAGRINLETAVRWVAPISLTPRVTALDPLHLAAHAVRHPARYYEPRIKSYGTFTRAISAPVGFIKNGDVSLSVLDPDNSVRQRIASKTIRKAKAELRLGPEGGPLSAFLRPLKRQVGTVSQPADGELSVDLEDQSFAFLEREVPSVINATNFPNLPESGEGFGSLVLGTVSAAGGALPCPLVDTANYSYFVCRHAATAVLAVYRKGQDDEDFGLVPAGEYTVVDDYEITSEGGEDVCTLIQFGVDQGSAEIRANVTGLVAHNGLTMTNFADALLATFEYLEWITDRADALNLASFEETRTRVASLVCAGAWTEALTFAEAVTQLQRSSNIDVFSDKNDRICIHYTTDDEEPTVHLDDLLRLHRGTVRQQLADPACNRIPYRYAPNYATGKWSEDKWDNAGDQEKLGEVVEDEPLQLYFVRDAATAVTVVERRGQYLDLDSFRFEAEIPLVPVLEELELANLVSIEHFGGIKSGGYTDEQFKVLELSMDIDRLKYGIKGIRRRLPPPTALASAAPVSGTLAINSRVGPFAGSTDGELFAIFRNPSDSKKLRAWYTDDYGLNWAAVDDANAPSLENTIASFDSFAFGSSIYVATQENSGGRVSYHKFSTASGTWTTVDEEVVAATSNGGSHCVSIECRYPGGEPVIYFQGDKELIGGQYWQRGWSSIRQSGAWSSPVMVTPNPGGYSENSDGIWAARAASSHCYVERVVAGRENRTHFFYSVNPAVNWVQWSPDEYAITMQENLSFGGKQWIACTSVYYPAPRNIGGVIPYDDRSKLILVRKSGAGGWGSAFVDVYAEGPSLVHLREKIADGTIYESFAGAENPAGFVGVDESGETPRLYLATACWGPRYVSVQESIDDGATWSAQVQAGPYYAYPTDIQSLFGNFFRIRGRMYMGYFSGPSFPMYRWLRIDKLPYTQ